MYENNRNTTWADGGVLVVVGTRVRRTGEFFETIGRFFFCFDKLTRVRRLFRTIRDNFIYYRDARKIRRSIKTKRPDRARFFFPRLFPINYTVLKTTTLPPTRVQFIICVVESFGFNRTPAAVYVRENCIGARARRNNVRTRSNKILDRPNRRSV